MQVAEELIDLIQDTPATKTYKPKKKRAGNKNLADVLMTRPGKEKKNMRQYTYESFSNQYPDESKAPSGYVISARR